MQEGLQLWEATFDRYLKWGSGDYAIMEQATPNILLVARAYYVPGYQLGIQHLPSPQGAQQKQQQEEEPQQEIELATPLQQQQEREVLSPQQHQRPKQKAKGLQQQQHEGPERKVTPQEEYQKQQQQRVQQELSESKGQKLISKDLLASAASAAAGLVLPEATPSAYLLLAAAAAPAPATDPRRQLHGVSDAVPAAAAVPGRNARFPQLHVGMLRLLEPPVEVTRARGECTETLRDLIHAQFGLGSLIEVAELVWQQVRL